MGAPTVISGDIPMNKDNQNGLRTGIVLKTFSYYLKINQKNYIRCEGEGRIFSGFREIFRKPSHQGAKTAALASTGTAEYDRIDHMQQNEKVKSQQ